MSPQFKAPLGRRATSYDVAVAAGVAQSTVSRCFRPDSEMSANTRARIQAVAAQLGYVPNALARSLITKRSNLVAVIVTDFTLRANPAIVGGIGRALAETGKQLLLFAVDADRGEAAPAAAQAAQTYPLDGLMVAATLAEEQIRPFLQRGVPVVFFNRPVALAQVDRVATDHATAAGTGRSPSPCRRPSPVRLSRRPRRLAGQHRARGGVRVRARRRHRAELGPRLRRRPHGFPGPRAPGRVPDAVFCVTDPLALGVLDACRFDLGLSVPRDLSVVGFDDVAEAAHQAYDLTTVRQPIDQLASAAVDMLVRRLDAPGAKASRLLLPGTLIERGSARLG